jgi:serine/threonine-protein kinase
LNDGSPLVDLDSLVGTVLDGRYRLDSLIGVGGMGDVYRATHVHLDTEFAVKLLKPEFVANQTAIKRFRLEAKAAGRIHHPNAIRVTDFGVTPEQIVYLVMELVHGESLRNLMRDEGAFDYIRTINIVRQVCGAVEAAHRSGVIHRDLKPDNILIEKVSDTERVKVLDFGIAKLKEAKSDGFLTQAGTIIGTPQYMSPEQCQSKPLDPTSDIYSIGIILYEMLSGEVPFDGESTIQVVFKQLHDPPRPILELAPNVPASLAQVVMRALEKEPDRRQSSALQLSDELKDAVEMAGEGEALSMTDPLVLRPLDAEIIRKRISEAETLQEQSDATPILAEDRPSSSGKETSVLSHASLETGGVSTQGESGRVTAPEERVPTAQSTLGGEQAAAELAAGRKAPSRLIALVAVALIALIGTMIYFSLRPAQTPPEPQTPTAPEGMVYIPGGKFMMGSQDGEPYEGPAHEVEVKPFFLDKYEVTNQDYKQFVEATGHRVPMHWKFNNSFAPDEAILPVTYVTWEDATAYARWANKRLPKEEEWEYAARGGDKGFRYPWGNEWREGYANTNREGQKKPSPIRSFEKDLSPFGVHDMAGNVGEWVQDFFTNGYGATPDQKFRIYRGGNFLSTPKDSLNTRRWSDSPDDKLADEVKPLIGFRCAKDIAQK